VTRGSVITAKLRTTVLSFCLILLMGTGAAPLAHASDTGDKNAASSGAQLNAAQVDAVCKHLATDPASFIRAGVARFGMPPVLSDALVDGGSAKDAAVWKIFKGYQAKDAPPHAPLCRAVLASVARDHLRAMYILETLPKELRKAWMPVAAMEAMAAQLPISAADIAGRTLEHLSSTEEAEASAWMTLVMAKAAVQANALPFWRYALGQLEKPYVDVLPDRAKTMVASLRTWLRWQVGYTDAPGLAAQTVRNTSDIPAKGLSLLLQVLLEAGRDADIKACAAKIHAEADHESLEYMQALVALTGGLTDIGFYDAAEFTLLKALERLPELSLQHKAQLISHAHNLGDMFSLSALCTAYAKDVSRAEDVPVLVLCPLVKEARLREIAAEHLDALTTEYLVAVLRSLRSNLDQENTTATPEHPCVDMSLQVVKGAALEDLPLWRLPDAIACMQALQPHITDMTQTRGISQKTKATADRLRGVSDFDRALTALAWGKRSATWPKGALCGMSPQQNPTALAMQKLCTASSNMLALDQRVDEAAKAAGQSLPFRLKELTWKLLNDRRMEKDYCRLMSDYYAGPHTPSDFLLAVTNPVCRRSFPLYSVKPEMLHDNDFQRQEPVMKLRMAAAAMVLNGASADIAEIVYSSWKEIAAQDAAAAFGVMAGELNMWGSIVAEKRKYLSAVNASYIRQYLFLAARVLLDMEANSRPYPAVIRKLEAIAVANNDEEKGRQSTFMGYEHLLDWIGGLPPEVRDAYHDVIVPLKLRAMLDAGDVESLLAVDTGLLVREETAHTWWVKGYLGVAAEPPDQVRWGTYLAGLYKANADIIAPLDTLLEAVEDTRCPFEDELKQRANMLASAVIDMANVEQKKQVWPAVDSRVQVRPRSRQLATQQTRKLASYVQGFVVDRLWCFEESLYGWLQSLTDKQRAQQQRVSWLVNIDNSGVMESFGVNSVSSPQERYEEDIFRELGDRCLHDIYFPTLGGGRLGLSISARLPASVGETSNIIGNRYEQVSRNLGRCTAHNLLLRTGSRSLFRARSQRTALAETLFDDAYSFVPQADVVAVVSESPLLGTEAKFRMLNKASGGMSLWYALGGIAGSVIVFIVLLIRRVRRKKRERQITFD